MRQKLIAIGVLAAMVMLTCVWIIIANGAP